MPKPDSELPPILDVDPFCGKEFSGLEDAATMQAMYGVLRNPNCFQFSLRTLFVLMTMFCVFLAYQLNWIQERHKALEELQQSRVVFDTYKPAPWSIRLIERGVPSPSTRMLRTMPRRSAD
jgi:hypothetical protein